MGKSLLCNKATQSEQASSLSTRQDFTETCLLVDAESRILIHMRLSVMRTLERSWRVSKDWWRTDTSLPPTGMADPGGRDVKINWSFKWFGKDLQWPGSRLKCVAGIAYRSEYQCRTQIRMYGKSWVIHMVRPINFSKLLFEVREFDNKVLIYLSIFSILESGISINPELKWMRHPIQWMVGPSSHLAHEIGMPVIWARMQIMAAASGMANLDW